MGVYIRGMEMPTSCNACMFDVYGLCLINKNIEGKDELTHSCPLVPVHSHGRLIDADALMLEIQEYIEEYSWETDEHGWHNEKWCAMKEAAMAIDAAPTILEAEEGET